MTLQIYNTLTREKEIFKPKNHDKVKVYFCWPTPYNFAHIWNLKTYIVEDIVIRTLRFLGYTITTTMNITDIDDKTIRDSQKVGKRLLDFTREYSNFFLEDIKKLWISKADNIKPISELIPEMVQIINGLLRKWYAYLADDGSIYYSIEKFKTYGKLANLNFEGMKSNVRINNDEYEKESIADFVLWKAYDKERDGENFWEATFVIPAQAGISPKKDSESSSEWRNTQILWRPGWHIECSACAMKFFGPEIDLHMGWVDNIFPHHQNEIAQTEAYTSKKFSRYWLHSAHLLVDGKKMSKSLGNFYTLRDIEEQFKDISKSLLYRAVRLSFIAGKYRDNIDFSFAKIETNFSTLKKLDETLRRLSEFKKNNEWDGKKTRRDFSYKLQWFVSHFIESLEDDFAIPEALVDVYETATFANIELDSKKISASEASALIELFRTYNQVLGIIDFSILDEVEVPQDIEQKLQARNAAKSEKNFTLADNLRDELLSAWWKIIDSREGTRVEKI
jgi:cysteinyl-tRNA synthetase